jgi:hypothetical protein
MAVCVFLTHAALFSTLFAFNPRIVVYGDGCACKYKKLTSKRADKKIWRIRVMSIRV